MSKILIDQSEKTAMFQVVAGNTQMCSKQVQSALENFESDKSEDNKFKLEVAQEQLKDHQAIYACMQAAFVMLNPTSIETASKTIDKHIERLNEEMEVNKDLDFHTKLEYNIFAWKKVKLIMRVLSIETSADFNFMEEWKEIKL